MSATVAPGLLVAFLLALVRAASWLAIAPPFNDRAIPPVAKVGIAASIALAVAPHMPQAAGGAPLGTAEFVGSVVLQAFTGVVLGFITNLAFSAVAAGGATLDLFGGFVLTAALDPMSLEQQPVIGRSFNLVATTLLFVMDAHLVLLRGFITSYRAVPLALPGLKAVSATLVGDLGWFLVAALEIAGPLVAVLFLADVALGLLSKAAPQLNIFTLSFGVKTVAVLLLVGTTLPLLPNAVTNVVDRAVADGLAVVGLRG